MKTIMQSCLGLALHLVSQPVVAQSWKYDLNPYDYSSGIGIVALLFGAAHALPILWVAYKTHSKVFTWLAAVGMSFVAAVVGSAAYTITDIFFVGIGTYLALKLHIENQSTSILAGCTSILDESEATESEQREADLYQLGKTQYFVEGAHQQGIQLLESAARNGNPWASKFLGDAYLLDGRLTTRPIIAAYWYEHARGLLKDEWDEGLTASIHVAKLAAEQGAASPGAVLSICEDACQAPCQESADSSAACFLMERYMSSNVPAVRQKAVRLATKFSVPTLATEEAVARIFMADEHICPVVF